MRKRKGRPVHGILLLDKPGGCSSNQILQRVKRLYGARKAGHTGSLDPLATGMLPICFGEATKISSYLLNSDKAYEVTMRFGQITDSADADGELIEQREVPADLNKASIGAVLERFVGEIQQIPPMVSAIKVNGQRLYKLAREGREVERKPRSVVISHLELLSFSQPCATLQVQCSKGTYVRSLVTDIGTAVGCGAHVVALRRLFVAPFSAHEMQTVDTVEQLLASDGTASIDRLLLPLDSALEHLPAVDLKADAEQHFFSGQASRLKNVQHVPVSGYCRVYGEGRRLLGLGRLDAGTPEQAITVAPHRVFQWQ